MSTLEEIGGILGFVAFAGVAGVIFVTFQQARHVRRLREWAGRAPERAIAAAERDEELAAEATEIRDEDESAGPSRWEVFKEGVRLRWAELDRRLPVDPKILLAGLAAVFAGVAIATSGFGLFGGDDPAATADDKADRSAKKEPEPAEPDEPVVAVLNASGAAPGQSGTPGLANEIGASVEEAGYELGEITDADSLPISVVMFAPGSEDAATDLAADLEPVLGSTETVELTDEIGALAGDAGLAVVIGFDDAGI